MKYEYSARCFFKHNPDPSIYVMDHPYLTVLNIVEYFIGLKRVEESCLKFDPSFHLYNGRYMCERRLVFYTD